MKKVHHETLKYHTIYSFILSAIFISIVLLNRDSALVVAIVFLIFYITGNGIIHTKHNELKRDTLIEYIIISVIALIILIDSVIR